MHVDGEASDGITALASECDVSLYVFSWSDHMSKAGLIQGVVYLLRPDGYFDYLGSHPEELGMACSRTQVSLYMSPAANSFPWAFSLVSQDRRLFLIVFAFSLIVVIGSHLDCCPPIHTTPW
jgi:hypothetical protein